MVLIFVQINSDAMLFFLFFSLTDYVLQNGFSKKLAEELAREALELGSKDNVSVAIVVFESKFKKCFAAAEKDKKRDRKVLVFSYPCLFPFPF